MAERRMFAKTIIDSDAFLDMPLSTQALYFHLSMRADDEGFINNPKKIQRTIGASDDDLKLLIAKSFIIPFESGIVVIKHWKIHNYIRGDRLHPTKYLEEKSILEVKENGAYTIPSVTCQSSDSQLVDTLDTEIRLGKVSLGKVSLGNSDEQAVTDTPKKTKDIKQRNIIPPDIEWVKAYCRERNNNVDPEKFFDFYTSKNWFVGKTKMKDWEASVRTWEKDEKKKPETKTDEYRQYKHGNYDFAAMEAELRRK